MVLLLRYHCSESVPDCLVIRLHLLHAMLVGFYMHKSNAIVPTPETVDSVGVWVVTPPGG